MSTETTSLRIAVVGIVVVSLFAALFARLYYLQVLRQTTVEEVFGSARYRDISYEGARGRILDVKGRVLVGNRESIVITVDRQRYEAVPDPEDLKLRLARALNDHGVPTKVSDVQSRLADPRYDPLKPVPVAEDVSPELESYLVERLFEFPSVDVVRTYVRTYPHGDLAAHLLGYIGSISDEELTTREDDDKRYEPGDVIGKAGVERVFESELRAMPGTRTVEVDAREVQIGLYDAEAPRPGADLRLTIDLDVQRAAETLLAQSLTDARQQKKSNPEDPDLRAPAGAVVVLDARSSAVVAMASYPTYDPSEFIGGISSSRFNELNDPASFFPFNNRAIQSLYSPGSTFKPLTAVAALNTGALSASEVITDRGSYTLEDCTNACVFRNAGSTPYGQVDLERALSVSSDVFFYRLGEKLWNDQARYGATPIQDTARSFGMGRPTGVQLPHENPGLISDPEFKRVRNEENPDAFPYGEWFTGDNVNLAIGQGDIGVTPLQLANAYAALANGGNLNVPSVAAALLDPLTGTPVLTYEPRRTATIQLEPEVREPIIQGLGRAVSDEEGTGFAAFSGFPLEQFPVAGKTGTAEVPPKADTAIFAGFGPVEDPRYVAVAFIEEAGFSSASAAPLVRQVFENLNGVAPAPPAPPPTPTTDAVDGEDGEVASAATADPGEVEEVAPAVVTPTATVSPPTTEPVPTVPSTPVPTTGPVATTAPAVTSLSTISGDASSGGTGIAAAPPEGQLSRRRSGATAVTHR